MAELRTYRHQRTGLIQVTHPRVAAAHPFLVEVADNAKPLAYTPIPQEAIEEYLASEDDEETD